jgi:hypothetical protein
VNKLGLFSCGSRRGKPYLNYEILWTPVLKARLGSHTWLADVDWPTFIETAEVGDVLDCKGIIVVVRLKEVPGDRDP